VLYRISLSLMTAFGLLLGFQGAAAATPVGVVNGATQLNVTSFGTLTDGLGVTVSPGGTAQVVSIPALPSPIVFYDVTSVDLDPASTAIFHEGSILDLTTTNTVSLSNFIIDATSGFVLADVFSSPGVDLQDAAILAINKACSVADPCVGLDETITIDGLELTLTAAAAGILSQELGIPDLTGAVFAVANSSFTPIPEPGTAVLALSGLALLGVAARRQRRLGIAARS
jgi:hypothetical protein